MQWLVANMWMALAAAGILGLLFGISIRGLMVGGKIRRAEVERDVAKMELEQTRNEVDALYAAQRKRQGETASENVPANDELLANLAEKEVQIANLNGALYDAKTEIEALKADQSEDGNLLGTAGAAIAGAVGGAALAGGSDEELTELKDRNAWLEERVASLETEISDVQLASHSEPAETIAAAAPEVDEPAVDTVAAEKMAWQNTYLRQRVEALEANIIDAPAGTVVAANTVEESVASDESEETVEAQAEVADTASDEEMARLRWRNRYLEGRLAYYEEAAEAVEATDENNDDDQSGLLAAGATALAGAAVASELLDDDEETETSTATDDISDEASADPADVAEEPDNEEVVEAGVDEVVEEIEEQEAVAEPDTTEVTEETSEAVEAREAVETIETETEPESDETSEDEATDAGDEQGASVDAPEGEDTKEESIPELEAVAEEDVHPSEALLAELDSAEVADEGSEAFEVVAEEAKVDDQVADAENTTVVADQPAQIAQPVGGGDDLTQIGGIGPRIAEVLNGLGIWTYAQIADWTAGNETWVEEHLSFKGRVDREQWVAQAKVLVATATA